MNYKVDKIINYSKTRGWLCGYFFPSNSILKNSETEVCIVIKGKLKYQLDGKNYILTKGDFIFMENNVKEAVLEVYEPTETVVIRTPSLPNNKVEVK